MQFQLSAYIIDDEQDSRENLSSLLREVCNDVKIVGIGEDLPSSAKEITITSPNIVFLDIRLGLNDGFDLFNYFPRPSFMTIFVTAYAEHAIQAIRKQAVDYLLKPLKTKELIIAVESARGIIMEQKNKSTPKNVIFDSGPSNISSKITLPIQDGLLSIKMEDIIRCEAEGNYTEFYFTNRNKILICKTLGYYEDALQSHGFIRVHSHHLVNLAHVVRYQRGRGGILFMSDKSEIIVSQRKRDQFLNVFDKF